MKNKVLNYTTSLLNFRRDHEPNSNWRVCSCHFSEGNKNNGPEIFKHNEGKLFPTQGSQKKKRNIKEIQPHSLPEAEKDQEIESSPIKPTSIAETVILQIELENKTKELQDLT